MALIMGSTAGRGDKSQEPICTQKADGPARAYWQALLTGDRGAVAEILSHPQNNLCPNTLFDTSDLEEWKNYRFNIRRLSTQRGRLDGAPRLSLALLLPGPCVLGAARVREERGWERECWDGVGFCHAVCGRVCVCLRAWGALGVPGPSSRGEASAWELLGFPHRAREVAAARHVLHVASPIARLCARSVRVQPVLGCWFSRGLFWQGIASAPC